MKKKKCCHCPEPSAPGVKGTGLCVYHVDVAKFGKAYADKKHNKNQQIIQDQAF